MKKTLLIPFLFASFFAFCQRSQVKIEPADFYHTWVLTSVHYGAETKKDSIEHKTIRFTPDSVFITVNNKSFSGTWHLKGLSFNISIKQNNDFDYHILWHKEHEFICIQRAGEDKNYECFDRKD